MRSATANGNVNNVNDVNNVNNVNNGEVHLCAS